jgi:hypothetical protein
MPSTYDKILKENMEAIVAPLVSILLGIQPEKFEEIPDELQKTIERKPDFLKKVVHSAQPKNNYILHIEFQTRNHSKMLYRMLEYYALLRSKYKIPVLQCVFFLGNEK